MKRTIKALLVLILLSSCSANTATPTVAPTPLPSSTPLPTQTPVPSITPTATPEVPETIKFGTDTWAKLDQAKKDELVAALPAKSPNGNIKGGASNLLNNNVYYYDSNGKPIEVYNFFTGEFTPSYKAEVVQIELTDGSMYEMRHFNSLEEALAIISTESKIYRGDARRQVEMDWTFQIEYDEMLRIRKILPGIHGISQYSLPRTGPDFFEMALHKTDSGYKMTIQHADGTCEMIDVTIRYPGDLQGALYAGSFDDSFEIPPLPSTPNTP